MNTCFGHGFEHACACTTHVLTFGAEHDGWLCADNSLQVWSYVEVGWILVGFRRVSYAFLALANHQVLAAQLPYDCFSRGSAANFAGILAITHPSL